MTEIIEFVEARYEEGRWVADCPHCNGAERVLPGEDFLCGSHWADLADQRQVQEPGLTAKDISSEVGQQYPVRFPNEKTQIEATFRGLPRHQVSWRLGEPF